MKKAISILILLLIVLLPSCKKAQTKQYSLTNSEEITDSTVVKFNPDTLSNSKINELEEYYKKPQKELLGGIVIIKDTHDLVTIAEPILFSIYGKSNILGERPYVAKLIGNFWQLSGSLPSGYVGGTFYMVINRKTCEIVRLSHGK